MKLRKLLKDIDVEEIKGSKEIEITGLCSNSKFAAPGNLFIAKRGGSYDGNIYIPEALDAGASAILTDIYNPFYKNTVQLIHPDVPDVEASLAANYYGSPDKKLLMVGVTGTNGKTTCSFMIKHLLDSVSKPCGLVGSLQYIIGSYHQEASHTTPDVITNYRLLNNMVSEGCHAAVMEVSSHALDQNRVQGIQFDAAIFTNLSQDHLDYHKTMKRYASSKALLFKGLSPRDKKALMPYHKTAIVNIDDPWNQYIIKSCKAPIITYAIDNDADVSASSIIYGRESTTFDVSYGGSTLPFTTSFPGKYNVYNILAVVAFGVTHGIPFETIPPLVSSIPAIAGRMQEVQNPLGIKVYVDSASTEDALHNVSSFLKSTAKNRLIIVFGCGGNRDKSKRPKMAQACEQHADICVVTTDNPRDENPETICRSITRAFSSGTNYVVEVDRREAIHYAIKIAEPGDTVLIAGKGHEKKQYFAHKTIPFDDVAIAEELCNDISQKKVTV
ncbi:MAG: UDP-N-acetylmuramoyl-L-alanyl-D-glutamate--2,6-diaminopimelate ligase [Waddliaceae bacterium]|nr:UDP-N-acetylmuramoyl-L-alanyl-D-glutamate--2,6-diaminopimelate ligase [Waddliaceae bacterium]MBT3579576.1 UDP-N-acetylmuramoyl-L-alanyl-D-glutamate--2,6-diaminopimelate ligase [Waddliaceae bacterium]MBT4444438.1 UDP-N-acetylmuramoyl-L-alanyl-D-glutamate--2,6-diaminopimelate ligase [Waddliaceae bacterium]MBT6928183.1 UDP-N-acetylmuramoyl-L-alanyl-D-glutamate--2,6-diaminopimelate ligase [Waddliaceae bacterium]MBT7264328.1 UDP-N-acetylmuramoyl-L-alanyl-D-glutamate--2,6-diaminopimelate ligase [W